MGVDALTVNASIGIDALEAMGAIAAERHAALYALVLTSNPGATLLQGAHLDDGRPWWELLATEVAAVDARLGGGVVGAVVGATRPHLLAPLRRLMPTAPLLLPGIGAQGGSADDLRDLAAAGSPATPPSLVVAARSLLPTEPLDTPAFRFAVTTAARDLAASLAAAH
jgi:orotidine-5'-phosphate decarboxylase